MQTCDNAGMGKVKSNLKTKKPTFIRAWRKHRKLTLERLSERVGVTSGALSQLERGEVGYTQPMLEAVADALDCTPSDLIMRDPKADEGLYVIWSQIPASDQRKALKVLKGFLADKAA